jgi:NAD(P)-dependent dehydrogenase (short-subunit alcohol dehydrogenase family)
MAAAHQKSMQSEFGFESTAQDVIEGADLHGKTAVVTGGYSGLGLETVKALAGAGAQVIVPARRPDVALHALEALSDSVSVVALDLADINSVDRFVADFLQKNSVLDILINNAAIMACPETRVGSGWEAQFATNHLGHFRMTNGLMPAILRAESPRIVSLSSAAHKYSDIIWDDMHFNVGSYEKWKAYGQAKTANSLFAVGLQCRFGGKGLDAFSVHPGGILTPLQRHLSIEEMVALGWTNDKGEVSEQAKAKFKSPAGGAATSIWCATSPKLAGKGGVYCEDCNIADLVTEASQRFVGVASWAVDPEAAGRLWTLSKKMLDGDS